VARYTAIGVDPGLANTGLAVIEVVENKGVARLWDTISTNSKDSVPKRLETIFNRIVRTLKEWNVRLLVLEDVYSLPKYPKAAMQLGAVCGILNLAAALEKVEVLEIKPTEVKMALTGNGRAPKDQLEKAVRRICGIKGRIGASHSSDALALAIVGLSRVGMVKW
jgi:crossover junction endodeoxyribonuclease RuvC